MSNVLDDSTMAGQNQGPTFLTVLCILSFIAAGIGIVVGILGAIAVAALQAGAAEMGASTSGAGNIWMFLIIAIVLTLVSLFGVIQMWKLKKTGFFIYTGASVASMIFNIVTALFGPSMVGIVIGVAFIVMYGLNTKHMAYISLTKFFSL